MDHTTGWRGQSRSGLSWVAACLRSYGRNRGTTRKRIPGLTRPPGRVSCVRGLADTLSVGERIAWYRQRCGMSQEVLAGLVGRTADWLSKIENNRIDLDRLSVLQSLASALDVKVGDLIGEPLLLDWSADSGRSTVPALRTALMDYRQITPLLGPELLTWRYKS
jgi:transcriptional regulator with XRE-family HTH domain